MYRLTREALDELFVYNMGNSLPGSHSVHAALVELRKIRFLMEQYNIPDLSALETLLKANAEGRAVVLPCKPQLFIYPVYRHEVLEWFVSGFLIDISGALIVECHDENTGIDAAFWPDDFGKTVFLTRQEAEAAIEKEKTNG